MKLKVAIQMDPIASINVKGDSTMLLGLEAQKRGYELWYYTPDQLTYNQGKITASAQRITLHASIDHHYDLGEAAVIDLSAMNVVLLRQDPPFNMPYLTTTYLLEQLPKKTLVVNDPASVRNHPEKIFPALFKQFTPPTLISSDIREIEHFRSEYKDIILKPLYGYGGRSVLRVKPGDDNFRALVEMQLSSSKEPLIAQAFLPEVSTGDRRVILIDGKVGGLFGRIPAEHEIRANLRTGGSPAKAELTKKQREICDALEPELKKRGLIFVGLDLIGDYLTEINLTSPTGLVQTNKLYGVTLEADIWNAIESHLP